MRQQDSDNSDRLRQARETETPGQALDGIPIIKRHHVTFFFFFAPNFAKLLKHISVIPFILNFMSCICEPLSALVLLNPLAWGKDWGNPRG